MSAKEVEIVELEEGEIPDDDEIVLSAENPATYLQQSSQRTLFRTRHSGSQIPRFDSRDIYPKSRHDGSFWGPVDLFETHKKLKKYPWFQSQKEGTRTPVPSSSRTDVIKKALAAAEVHDPSTRSPRFMSKPVPRQGRRDFNSRTISFDEKIQNCSYEELLEQYKEIRKSYGLLGKEADKTVEKSVSKTKNSASRKPTKQRRGKRRSRTHSSSSGSLQKNGKTTKEAIKNIADSLKFPLCNKLPENNVEDEDELELRRIALESANKKHKPNETIPEVVQNLAVEARNDDGNYMFYHDTKRNVNRCLRKIDVVDINPTAIPAESNPTNVLGDNYETVEMELDTDIEDPGKENSLIAEPVLVQSKSQPKQAVVPAQESDSFPKLDQQEVNDNLEEDEEILRAQLLMSLAAHNKLNTVNELDNSLEKKESSPDNVKSKRTMCQDYFTNVPKPLIINLGEDSSDSEDEVPKTKNDAKIDNIADNINAFIKQVRQESTASLKEAGRTVTYGSSMPLEYYLLKSEIAKREAARNRSLTGSPVASAPHSPLRDDSNIGAQKGSDIIKNELLKQESSLKQLKARLHEEELRKKTVLSQISGYKTIQHKFRIRIMTIKNALIAAENNFRKNEIKMKKLIAQVGLIQSSINKKIEVINAAEKQNKKILVNFLKDNNLSKSSPSSSQSAQPAHSKTSPKTISHLVAKYQENNMTKTPVKRKLSVKRSLSSEKKNFNTQLEEAKKKNAMTNCVPKTTINSSASSHSSPIANNGQAQTDKSTSMSQKIKNKLTDDNVKIYKNLIKNIFSPTPISTLNVPRLKARSFFESHVFKAAKKNEKLTKLKLKYESPLLSFRSYRFSPYFKASKRSYSSEAFSHRMDPNKMLCNFELTGICNDDECRGLHESDYKLSTSLILSDLSSYFPSMCGLNNATSSSNHQEILERFNKQAIGVSEFADVAVEDYCSILIDYLNKARKDKGHYVVLEKRQWKPSSFQDLSSTKKEFVEDSKLELLYNVENEKPNTSEKSEGRYFVSDDSCGDVFYTQNRYSILERRLNKLSQLLEQDSSSSEIWIEYLELYSKWPNNNISDYCQKALQLAPSYNVWWKCLDVEKRFSRKVLLCDDLMQFVSANECDTHLKSHKLLETILYKCQLCLVTGHQKLATTSLQTFLGLTNKQGSLLDLLQEADYNFLWICYIHLIAFGSLLPNIFDPNDHNYLRLFSKELYVINWQKSAMVAPVDQVLNCFYKYLHLSDKLAAGENCTEQSLSLYVNLINLKLFKKEVDQAIRICEKLVKVLPESQDAWSFLLCVNAGCENVYQFANQVTLKSCTSMTIFPYPVTKNRRTIKHSNKEELDLQPDDSSNYAALKPESLLQIYDEACKNVGDCSAITHLFVCLLEDLNLIKTLLLQYISKKANCEVDNEESGLLLFRKMLNVSQNIDSVFDDDSASRQVQDSDSVTYCWLNYCILLELSIYSSETLIDAYETAIWSHHRMSNTKKIWCQYLCYVLRMNLKSKDLASGQQFANLVKKCLLTMTVNVPSPYSGKKVLCDYHFHNQVIDLFMSNVANDDNKVNSLGAILNIYSNNYDVANRIFKYFITIKEFHSARYLCDFFSSKLIPSVPFWKTAICLTMLQDDGNAERVRKTFSDAVKSLPYSATLWKDFVLYEFSMGSSANVLSVMDSCSEYDVNIKEFVKYLLHIKEFQR